LLEKPIFSISFRYTFVSYPLVVTSLLTELAKSIGIPNIFQFKNSQQHDHSVIQALKINGTMETNLICPMCSLYFMIHEWINCASKHTHLHKKLLYIRSTENKGTVSTPAVPCNF